MKKFIFTLAVCLLATPLYAGNQRVEIVGENACALFAVLNVQSVSIPNDVNDLAVFQKSLSGLLCTYWIDELNRSDYNGCCIFSKSLEDFQKEEIYYNLNTEEKFSSSEDGYVKTYTKTVGSLIFSKVFYFRNEHEFATKYYFSVLGE